MFHSKLVQPLRQFLILYHPPHTKLVLDFAPRSRVYGFNLDLSGLTSSLHDVGEFELIFGSLETRNQDTTGLYFSTRNQDTTPWELSSGVRDRTRH